MYTGTTMRRSSGKFLGVHQKIDRASRRQLRKYLPKSIEFPVIKEILHFEGNNGPDGIMRKSPSVDEPWYYINPNDPNDHKLLDIIGDHIYNLSVALKTNNHVRAAFEAAWMAHAIVDGLTPAHHYPLGDKIEELWGKPHHERTSIKEKYIIRGDGIVDSMSKNWEYWGAGGSFTKHVKFEAGVVSTVAALPFRDIYLEKRDISQLERDGFTMVFLKSVKKIDELKMYEHLGSKGWTSRLAKQTKDILVPEMIKVVSLAWYQAILDASKTKP